MKKIQIYALYEVKNGLKALKIISSKYISHGLSPDGKMCFQSLSTTIFELEFYFCT